MSSGLLVLAQLERPRSGDRSQPTWRLPRLTPPGHLPLPSSWIVDASVRGDLLLHLQRWAVVTPSVPHSAEHHGHLLSLGEACAMLGDIVEGFSCPPFCISKSPVCAPGIPQVQLGTEKLRPSEPPTRVSSLAAPLHPFPCCSIYGAPRAGPLTRILEGWLGW